MKPLLPYSSLWRRLGILPILALAVLPARAEHFDIMLSVQQGNGRVEAYADHTPPEGGVNERPVLHAEAGQSIVLQFFMSDVNPHEVLDEVTVRYFIVPELAAGQKNVPPTNEEAVVKGEFLLDFAPDKQVGLRQVFRIEKPGTYLLRIESDNSHSDHEHFSAVDIEVE